MHLEAQTMNINVVEMREGEKKNVEVPEAGDFQQRSTYVSSISIPQHPVGPTPRRPDSVLPFPYLGLKL